MSTVKIPRISEPKWIENIPSEVRCTACVATIAKGGRYLTDRYKPMSLCEQCAQVAIEVLSKRRMNHNKEIQRHPNCPQCHTPYPLTATKAPVNQHSLAVLLVNLARSEEVECNAGYPDRSDRLYPCGCRSHDGHYSDPWRFCAAHKPAGDQVTFTGCCYVCEFPITSAARAYQRNLFAPDTTSCVRIDDDVRDARQAA